MTTDLYLGNDLVDPKKHLTEIRSSYPDEPTDTLRQRLKEDGYLCVRQAIPRETVLNTRRQMLKFMSSKDALTPDSTFENPKGKAIGMMGKAEITHHPDFLATVENPTLFSLFKKLFDEPARTFDYKWARAVPPGVAGTGAHMDYVYMGRGSESLHTTWVPMGDIPRENGPMVLLDKSHAIKTMERIRKTYGQMDVDRDRVEGWFGKDYLEISQISGSKWLVGDYQAGDIILMGMHLMHGSLRNTTDYLRLTCDIRFQPASDPIDERWVGTEPVGHYGKGKDKPIAVARKEWGV